MRRASSWSAYLAPIVVIASTTGLALLAAPGCDGKIEAGAEPAGDAGSGAPEAGEESGTTTATCAARGGVCLPEGESAPPNRVPSAEPLCEAGHVCWLPVPAGDEPCAEDADCNEDPAVSAMHGTCFSGVCVCTVGYVQPSGKCGAAPPGDCAAHGGTCRQDPAECEAGELQGELETNSSCGDFVPALCCVPVDACKGPADLVCCGAAASAYEPLCVNGWRTCGPAAPTPRTRQQGCP